MLLGRKHRQLIKKQRHYFADKVYLVKAMVFPVTMCGYESWTIKKAERQRIDASELWCWRRLLGVPWTARRSNKTMLKEINPEYPLEGLMLKLKRHTLATWWPHWKRPWCWERLKAGGEGTTEDEMVDWHWEGNRQEGQGSPKGGNSLQVSDIFISLKRQKETN